jgi:hypothetical protein
MSCPHCGAPDDTDLQAQRSNLVYIAEAARQCGRSATWVHYRIDAGDLKTQEFAGRTYVTRTSLNELLQTQGPGTTEFEIQRLLQAGDWSGAQALDVATNPISRMAASYAMPSGLVEKPARQEDFAADLVRKYGG